MAVLGVSGCVSSGLGLFGNNKHVDDASPGKKVEVDGDVVIDSRSTLNNAGSVDTSKLLLITTCHEQYESVYDGHTLLRQAGDGYGR